MAAPNRKAPAEPDQTMVKVELKATYTYWGGKDYVRGDQFEVPAHVAEMWERQYKQDGDRFGAVRVPAVKTSTAKK